MNTANDMNAAAAETNTATLLFVDDEANILSSLRRLFRPLGYTIHTAPGGAEGLEILAQHPIDLVISDMRMPQMDGAAFLARVAAQWPDTVRILLTGYSDMSSTVDAINKGKIYQYIGKPWNDDDIKITVRNALEQYYIKKERDRLLVLTQQQNAELQDLNANLEQKVKQRTMALAKAKDAIELAHKDLKRSYIATIKVFSNIIELREGTVAGHSRRIADHARIMAQKCGMDSDRVQQVMFAALLRDIGKIGLPSKIASKPVDRLTNIERAEFIKHPLIAEGLLAELDILKPATKLIRSHCERYDGFGYPDHLKGDEIPLGARIIAIANDYNAMQNPALTEAPLTLKQAREFLIKHKERRYDPELVNMFLELLGTEIAGGSIALHAVKCLKSNALEAGMILARDLPISDDAVWLAEGTVLTEELIEKIADIEKFNEKEFDIYVKGQGTGK